MADFSDFEEGDVVKLKSGGPDMTVSTVDAPGTIGSNYIKCNWFSGAKRQTGKFQPDELEHVDEDEEDG